jgi:predicted nucleic acid-binding protein
MKVYLDACCLNRMTDDQSQARIREEAGAIERILAAVRLGRLEMISSKALEAELRRNPSVARRLEAEAFLEIASLIVTIDDSVAGRAAELTNLGYGVFDSLHLAAAESVGVDVFLSTDDRLIKRATRGVGDPRIEVWNPVSWIREQGL